MQKVIITYLGTDESHKTGMLSLQIPFNNPVYYKIVSLEDLKNGMLTAIIEDKKKNILYVFGLTEDELCCSIVEKYYYDDIKCEYIVE